MPGRHGRQHVAVRTQPEFLPPLPTGTYAPLTPCWGYENRTVSVRIPAMCPMRPGLNTGCPVRMRIRLPGDRGNPGRMLHGIENKLQAPQPLEGNAYELLEPTLPGTGRMPWPASNSRISSATPSAARSSTFIRYSSTRRWRISTAR